MKVRVIEELCDGYGECEAVAPRAFRTDPDGGPVHILMTDDIPEDYEGRVIRAVEKCPKNALRLDPDPLAD